MLTSFLEAVSRQTAARVVTVEYELAPEANGSKQVADVLSVYRYFLGRGVAAGKMAIAGESGGKGVRGGGARVTGWHPLGSGAMAHRAPAHLDKCR